MTFNVLSPSAQAPGGGTIVFADPAVTVAADAAIPTGTYIGQITSAATLSILNGACNQSTPVIFDVVEASTPQTTSSIIWPVGPDDNPLANLAEDDGDLDNDGGVDEAAFANNGVADGADAYPGFIRDAFDPDGPGGPAQPIVPRARYFGVAVVAGSAISPLQLLTFEPGALTALPGTGWMTAAWGMPIVSIAGGTQGPPAQNSISGVCQTASSTPLFGRTHDNACTPVAGSLSGCSTSAGGHTLRLAIDGGCPGDFSRLPNECNFVRATNPTPPGRTVTWRAYSLSLRDWDSNKTPPRDGDGIENGLDPCPGYVDSWNPRVANAPEDSDGDGLPSTCDPNPATFNNDQDGDGWLNRQDNCPLVSNGVHTTVPNLFQFDQDIPNGTLVPDGGTRADGIGPECDPNPTGINGHYHATVTVSRVCIGLSDSDGDGVCDGDDPNASSTDSDADGVSDRFDNCINGRNGPNLNGPPPGFAQSQRDLNADGFSDGTDITIVAGAFGKVGGDPLLPAGYQGRLDLNYDSSVDGSDQTLVSGTYNKRC